jgi:ABC-type multidrug transport system ATPase subunit
MAKIHSLRINNYRCIEEFDQVFNNQSFVCLIGRGDSGKSTLLQAIAAVLSPSWNYPFYDTDFYNGDTGNSIVIEVSLYDVPSDLLKESKFGLYKRILRADNQIIDYFTDERDGDKDLLTIRLAVQGDLEPKWHVVNGRESQEDIEIRANDRAKLNTFIVSDYIDRHFSWGKGSPLYSLLKRDGEEIDTDQIIVDANRGAYESINNPEIFEPFSTLLERIKVFAQGLGLSIEALKALIDFKNFLVKEGSISLHDENNIPIRLKGKGTKRLLSIAIQLALATVEGGIILIDEVEQGLEPDRVKFLVKQLKEMNKGQVFITTHSNNVLVELDYNNLLLKRERGNKLVEFDEDFQGCLRNNSNAFFSRRVIVCEGATEVGICRALNEHRIATEKRSLELGAISLVDGTGSAFIDYCLKFKEAGFDVCAFCDSDDDTIYEKKKELIENEIEVVDCDDSNAIEQQFFNDLPWDKVTSLLEYAKDTSGEQSVFDRLSIRSLYELENTKETRGLIGLKAKGKDNKKGWFKSIGHGEVLGRVWFSSLNEIEETHLKAQYDGLMNWIDRK